MLKLEERVDVFPICPHCSKELMTVWMRQIRSMLGRRYVYFCPNYRKVLGVTHRKGFWMG